MHMADWIVKLDDFLRLSERDILTHAGRISHDQAEQHAHTEYELFDDQRRKLADAADSTDFDDAARRLIDQAPPPKPRRQKKPDQPGEEAV
jgi:hypothetical protein